VEAQSYREIALSLGVDDPAQITFATDVFGEAVAAAQAGWRAVLVTRPGNKPLPADAESQFPIISSMEHLL
jgi:methionine salvage enolase-phosphatase E1